jgi:CDP-diacylglycerol---serine O-phosphatidyltransferase
MKIGKLIPNTLTGLNLTCGLVSIVLAMEVKDANFIWPALFIFLAAVFDYLDGTAARLLNAYSELGKQLDSLADVVSFGVAPGIIMFRILSNPTLTSSNILERMHIIPYLALLIPICSAFRLAKFNIDPRQEVNFIGLPTPANAIFFASIPLILSLQPYIFTIIKLTFFIEFFSNARILTILIVFFSYLLVSEFRLFSMKFKTRTFVDNKVRYIFLGMSIVLLILFSLSSIPLIILTYLLLSMFFQKQIGS